MGVTAATQGTSDDLIGLVRLLGQNLSHQAFGEQGPDLKMTLADLERRLKPLVDALASGFLSAATGEQAQRLIDIQPCPTCGRECSRIPRERTILGEYGSFTWPEPTYHCEYCERSFFPSADRVED